MFHSFKTMCVFCSRCSGSAVEQWSSRSSDFGTRHSGHSSVGIATHTHSRYNNHWYYGIATLRIHNDLRWFGWAILSKLEERPELCRAWASALQIMRTNINLYLESSKLEHKLFFLSADFLDTIPEVYPLECRQIINHRIWSSWSLYWFISLLFCSSKTASLFLLISSCSAVLPLDPASASEEITSVALICLFFAFLAVEIEADFSVFSWSSFFFLPVSVAFFRSGSLFFPFPELSSLGSRSLSTEPSESSSSSSMKSR